MIELEQVKLHNKNIRNYIKSYEKHGLEYNDYAQSSFKKMLVNIFSSKQKVVECYNRIIEEHNALVDDVNKKIYEYEKNNATKNILNKVVQELKGQENELRILKKKVRRDYNYDYAVWLYKTINNTTMELNASKFNVEMTYLVNKLENAKLEAERLPEYDFCIEFYKKLNDGSEKIVDMQHMALKLIDSMNIYNNDQKQKISLVEEIGINLLIENKIIKDSKIKFGKQKINDIKQIERHEIDETTDLDFYLKYGKECVKELTKLLDECKLEKKKDNSKDSAIDYEDEHMYTND